MPDLSLPMQSDVPSSRQVPLFLLGLSFAFFVPFGGQLYLGEVAVLLCIPFVLVSKNNRAGWSGLGSWVIAAAIFMSAGGVLAGYFSADPAAIIVARLAAAVSFAATIFFFQLLRTSVHEHVIVLVGFVLGWILATFAQPTADTLEAPWKFGIGVPVSILAVWAVGRVNRPLAAILIIGLATINLLLDFRSLTLICLATVILGWNQLGSTVVRTFASRFALLRTWALLAACLAAGSLSAAAYGQLAGAGMLGKAAQYRYQLQGSGDLLGMILGGRFEIFYSLPSALRNPILGYGASSPIPPDVSNEGTGRLIALGLQLVAERGSSRENIPTHSAIMSGWIYSGIFGLIFWLLLAGILAYVVLNIARLAPIPPVMIFVTILGLWNVAYSPFGATTRILFAITISFAICLIKTHKLVAGTRIDAERTAR